MPKHNNIKSSVPLFVAVFVLSIFIGIIVSLVVTGWVKANYSEIIKIQQKEENQRIEKLLDKATYLK